MTKFSFGQGLAAFWVGLFLLGGGTFVEASQTGVFVEVKESEAPDARVIERWKLYGSSHALVIGINEYSGNWPRLSNAINDAREVAHALEARGFDVTLEKDLTGDELRRVLTNFYAIKGFDPDARLLVWFAGHGYSSNGEGYLVPSDAGSPSKPEFYATAFPMRDFGSLVRRARAKHAMAIFDSCFAGTVFNVQRSRPPVAVTQATKKPVRQFLTSGDAEQQVADDGTFRDLFIDALNGEEKADLNDDGYLTGAELGFYLEDRLTELTEGHQTPRSGKLRDRQFDQGDFVFLLPKKLAALAAEQTEAAQSSAQAAGSGEAARDHRAFWDSIRDSKVAEEFQAYLDTYPDGTFALLAQSRLKQLQAGQEPKVEPATDSEVEQQLTAIPRTAEPPPEFEIEEMEAPYRVTTQANVRAGPAASFDKIDTLSFGQEVTVTGKVKGANWFRIGFGDSDQGFIFGQLIQDEATYQAARAAAQEEEAPHQAQASSAAVAEPVDTQVAVGADLDQSNKVFIRREHSGLYVEVKESEAPDARVIERRKLYGPSHALVIGINEYGGSWPRLSNAINDARQVADALEARGFAVTLETNVTSNELRQVLSNFFVIKGADPEARLVVWYAGHGFSPNGKGLFSGEAYLVPADAGAPSKPGFYEKAFPMRDFGSLVRLAEAKHALAIFDSSFAASIIDVERSPPSAANTNVQRSRPTVVNTIMQRSRPPAAITEAIKKPVRQFLTSGDAGQRVADDGTFRSLFIDALDDVDVADANADGYLTGLELVFYIEQRLTNLTRGQQTPRSGKIRDDRFNQGDFVFVLPKRP